MKLRELLHEDDLDTMLKKHPKPVIKTPQDVEDYFFQMKEGWKIDADFEIDEEEDSIRFSTAIDDEDEYEDDPALDKVWEFFEFIMDVLEDTKFDAQRDANNHAMFLTVRW